MEKRQMMPWEEYQQQAVPTQDLKPWEEYTAAKNSTPMQQESKEGFFDPITKPFSEFNNSMRERGGRFADIVQNPQGFSGTSRALQAAGNVVGTGTDMLGVPVKAGMNMAYDMLPASFQHGLNKVASSVAPLVEAYNNNEATYQKINPEAAGNYRAIRELGGALSLANSGIRDAAISGAETAAKGGASALKNVTKDTAMYPVEGIATAIKGVNPLGEAENTQIKSYYNNLADKHYGAMRDEEAKINPAKTAEIFSSIDDSMNKRGILNPALHGKTMAVISDLKNAAKDGTLDLETLDQQRRVLSRIKSIDNPEDPGMARAAIRAIDKQIKSITGEDLTQGTPSAVENLYAGRAASQKAIKIDKIAQLLKKAKGDPNRIKALFTTFVNKKGNLDGFNATEQEALLSAAETSAAEKLLKMGGKFGLDLGTSLTPGNTALPVISGVLTGTGGGAAAVVGGGTIAKQLQKYMARGKADEVIKAIVGGKIPKEMGKIPAKEAQDIIQKARKLPKDYRGD